MSVSLSEMLAVEFSLWRKCARVVFRRQQVERGCSAHGSPAGTCSDVQCLLACSIPCFSHTARHAPKITSIRINIAITCSPWLHSAPPRPLSSPPSSLWRAPSFCQQPQHPLAEFLSYIAYDCHHSFPQHSHPYRHYWETSGMV